MVGQKIQIKKIIYQSTHRGGKELDMILGGFAQKYGPSLTKADLLAFEKLIQMDDGALRALFLEEKPAPQQVLNLTPRMGALIRQVNRYKMLEIFG